MLKASVPGWGAGSGTRRRAWSTWLLLSALLVIHLVCWTATRSLRRPTPATATAPSLVRLVQRASAEPSLSVEEQTTIPSYFPYLDWYQGLSSRAKPAGFVALVLWLCFLFSFVGTVASDFFCPNLSTIAARLGLPESVAGVTFLGLGNGSPDVFSTFAAMKADTGPLAIGELIGAASFIVAVVAGSMTLIRPFRVPRHSFLRDVGFFTLATAFLLAILWDGKIEGWEAGAMVGMYAIYVAIVGFGTWWMERKRRRRELLHKVRSEYAEEGQEPEYHDDPDFPQQPASPVAVRPILQKTRSTASISSSLLTSPHLGSLTFSIHPRNEREVADEAVLLDLAKDAEHYSHHAARPVRLGLSRQRTLSSAGYSGRYRELTPGPEDALPSTSPGHRHPHHHHHPTTVIRPSLLGAIEFRDVVLSLATEARASSLSPRPPSPSLGDFSARPRASSYHGSTSPASDPGPSNTLSVVTAGRRIGHRTSRSAVIETSRPPWSWETDAGGQADDGDPAPAVWTREHPPSPLSEESDGVGRRDAAALSIGSATEIEDPWRNATPKQLPLLSIPGVSRTPSEPGSLTLEGRTAPEIPAITVTGDSGMPKPLSPPFQAPGANGYGRSGEGVNPLFRPGKRRRLWLACKTSLVVLFPALQNWRAKSWIGRVVAVATSPAILLLNLTLPVVDDEGSECESEGEKPAGGGADSDEGESSDNEGDADSVLSAERRRRDQGIASALHSPVDFRHHESDPLRAGLSDSRRQSLSPAPSSSWRPPPPAAAHGEPPPPPPLPPLEEGPSDGAVVRTLAAVQCFLAPGFCVAALLGGDMEPWHAPAALGAGLLLGGAAYAWLTHPSHPGRLALCFVGFLVAMVWILTIVGEVVGVLQCVGRVFGLSDAILGLTIFAMGNSLGDLVANVTIARMGFPVMAMSACFGGPMLNVLLGVGLSSSYIIASTGQPYPIDFSPTLIVSAVGLLVILCATLVVVPLNGFLMSRKTGSLLILAYALVLAVNVLVEMRWSH